MPKVKLNQEPPSDRMPSKEKEIDETFCYSCQETIPYTDKRDKCFICEKTCCDVCAITINKKWYCPECFKPQEPPVCPGCRRTIGKIQIVITEVEVEGERGKMISVCCANKNCGMLLTADVRGEEELEQKPNLIRLH